MLLQQVRCDVEGVIVIDSTLEFAAANNLDVVLAHQTKDTALTNSKVQFTQFLGNASFVCFGKSPTALVVRWETSSAKAGVAISAVKATSNAFMDQASLNMARVAARTQTAHRRTDCRRCQGRSRTALAQDSRRRSHRAP